MAYATVDDLQSRMVYEMASNERAIAEVLLDDASNKLDMEFSNKGKDMRLGEPDFDAALTRICCNLVARVLSTGVQTDMDTYSNPNIASFTQQSSFYDGSGMLRLTMDERAELGIPRNAGRAAFGRA